MVILAIDPGGTTGWIQVWVQASPPGQPVHPVHPVLVRWGTFATLEDEISMSPQMYKGVDVVVAESYIIRPDTATANIGLDLNAVKVLGRAELWVLQYNVREPALHLQTPAQAKQQWTNRRLKGHFPGNTLYPSGAPGGHPGALCRHEVDALRHAMTYIENCLLGSPLVLTDEEHLI